MSLKDEQPLVEKQETVPEKLSFLEKHIRKIAPEKASWVLEQLNNMSEQEKAEVLSYGKREFLKKVFDQITMIPLGVSGIFLFAAFWGTGMVELESRITYVCLKCDDLKNEIISNLEVCLLLFGVYLLLTLVLKGSLKLLFGSLPLDFVKDPEKLTRKSLHYPEVPPFELFYHMIRDALDSRTEREINWIWKSSAYSISLIQPITSQDYLEFRDNELWKKNVVLSLVKGRILDVGAGTGKYTLWLQEQGQDVVALESSRIALELMKHRGITQVLEGDLAKLPYADFETLILMNDVLGAFHSPTMLLNWLKEMATSLKPDSQMLIDLISHDDYLFESFTGFFVYEPGRLKSHSFQWGGVPLKILELMCQETGLKFEILASSVNKTSHLCRITPPGRMNHE
ncbi:MAG: class I SAM-dependent methyltransferase [SAR324 cluster bacterium]|nr:class I SAM-dependent methyltransferase [SAR324 cluster bacterium]